ncbi:50S ribosomal protein L29 [Candidatus Daviesbacteria bacterium]|nr:50S ribosomal protein L29 [Candidatus Daviesbacteria bacterium]
MKKNDLMEVKKLDIKALIDKSKALKNEISELVLDKNMDKLKDLKVISKKRKDLAQTMTVIRQKQLIEKLSVLSGQLSDTSSPVVSQPVKTEKQKTDNRKGTKK